jgi:hypothetical protein
MLWRVAVDEEGDTGNQQYGSIDPIWVDRLRGFWEWPFWSNRRGTDLMVRDR